jgi:precorrin-2 dehydrogenase/sirohydrochlorin ferrochelatase
MKYYPVNLDIQNKACLVVGGGSVGTRKVKTLVKCGAGVTVVSPDMSFELKSMGDHKKIKLKNRVYETKDLQGMFLVIGATGNETVNRKISEDAGRLNMLCNIADVPDACNFILPAFVEQGDLVISVSTSGKSPAFAKKLKTDLEKTFGEEYAIFLELMGAIRKKLLSEKHAPEAHKHLFDRLIENNLPELIKQRKNDDINSLLYDVLGEGYDFEKMVNKWNM